MRILRDSDLHCVAGGADEPNPGNASAGGVLIGVGVAITAQAGGGTAAFTGATAIPGVGAAAIAGAGGYMVGGYLEEKYGTGTSLLDWFMWTGWKVNFPNKPYPGLNQLMQ